MTSIRRLRADENACALVKKAIRTTGMDNNESLSRIQELITSIDDDPAKGPAMREISAKLQRFVAKLGQVRARSYVDEPS